MSRLADATGHSGCGMAEVVDALGDWGEYLDTHLTVIRRLYLELHCTLYILVVMVNHKVETVRMFDGTQNLIVTAILHHMIPCLCPRLCWLVTIKLISY